MGHHGTPHEHEHEDEHQEHGSPNPRRRRRRGWSRTPKTDQLQAILRWTSLTVQALKLAHTITTIPWPWP